LIPKFYDEIFFIFLRLLFFSPAFIWPREPMKRIQRIRHVPWLNKKVLDKRTLDNMESLDNWRTFTTSGVEIVDARRLSKQKTQAVLLPPSNFQKEFVHEGNQSLLITTTGKT